MIINSTTKIGSYNNRFALRFTDPKGEAVIERIIPFFLSAR